MRMTEIAVTSINRFLSSVYFDAARFRLVPFGDVYRIESFGKPVAPKAISTGERNILALCYFFSEGGRCSYSSVKRDSPFRWAFLAMPTQALPGLRSPPAVRLRTEPCPS